VQVYLDSSVYKGTGAPAASSGKDQG
jgi:hypothetical protein